ncbi:MULTISPECIES: hypothetical protein [Nostoc]|uniref:hypothetical protein n=1 Tax=Nostoc TaxID=1177 RepID=UPI0016820DBA|nr:MULTISPECIES: hypothetical protein [Nostoc]
MGHWAWGMGHWALGIGHWVWVINSGVAESEYEMPKLPFLFFVPLRLCDFA